MVNDFIFELGCEELPSGSVWPLADEFANLLLTALDKAQLVYGQVKRYATPRRIAVAILGLQAQQQSQRITRRGPALAAAYDKEGNPSPALLGFVKSCGAELEQLSRLETEKGAWIVYETQSQGNKTKDLLPTLISQALATLSISKPMRWGSGDDEFARPVHWIVTLYGDDVIEYTLLGIQSGRISRGHRFHHPQQISIHSAQSYEAQMKEAFVMADFAHRRQIIQEQVKQLAASYQATAIMPESLLDEVTSIVEWPQALMADFEKEFLEVPAESLIASMQSHQKCFALKDKQGNLLPHFITVSNIVSSNPKQVIMGNEKVMRARLSDAAFFFRQDKKQALSQRIPGTEHVVFQAKLGTLLDKALRVEAMMTYLSAALNLEVHQAQRAAQLSKCDLLTGMVGEFPELQGLMGYYYALNDGEDQAVAHALNEQYMPRFSADSLPKSDLGLALSLAERVDTLVGIFAIGQKPSGVKDPFKLRRHALAVVRLLISTRAPLNLSTLIEQAITHYGVTVSIEPNLRHELKLFILDRLQSYYQGQGLSIDLIHAGRARQDEWLYDLDKRLSALQAFVTLPEAASLSAACKRVNNLLAQIEKHVLPPIKEELFEDEVEKSLYTQIKHISQAVEPLYRTGEYSSLLKLLATLKEPVDAFFDKVMVMVDDASIKSNRLALLVCLQDLLQGVADISLLQI
ncbi:glycine--tRNA ligase subunit beta [Legionella longbeachae]|uniref:Glycine--tRNA ligase beta subunit n=1 Tax=Legionella longbeachae serogroup 1 (strain NSW150) TaxID=661367 RepID=D3HR83_LEGLN|nr:glycine--tRNA ligase subunit beta [Legionella longbeachae]VEE01921.1 glycyl-tRNA synthetase beta chain [Legionella oakridgensis]HBD7396828.1 glycine--tRNA ligase subunit beta [Legionella pneumophila]ARB91764.1 glycine--tRNA ligase subunit beta [Legionella longbeachae]QEY51035.1 glycine--tRNA ligase subunit beta [Legionella longbeachae]QIN35158.1 glycine--tRNA ligase subunit beta [Legionella longbeachae]